jgi:hypothetical protein
MSTNTSIGPGAARGGNEDHGNADGRGNKTLGEHAVPEEPAAGADRDKQPAQPVSGEPTPRER